MTKRPPDGTDFSPKMITLFIRRTAGGRTFCCSSPARVRVRSSVGRRISHCEYADWPPPGTGARPAPATTVYGSRAVRVPRYVNFVALVSDRRDEDDGRRPRRASAFGRTTGPARARPAVTHLTVFATPR
ncbi:hypothetical protein EVAR_4857_1 [Eumeta japonica]|uniref:Uncharacterized protein n=1 Tax=Eumeta variegata TaxID=151549 RepID=A0A4C1SZ30_EUMVA|nr:hypothetical protein EVAR_4857_1 [Eumeta japonica]